MIRSRIILACLVALLAGVLGFLAFSPQTSIRAFTKIGYPSIALSFVLFCYFTGKVVPWRACWERVRGGGWKGLALVIVTAAILQMQEKHGFKMVMDEVVL